MFNGVSKSAHAKHEDVVDDSIVVGVCDVCRNFVASLPFFLHTDDV